MRQKMRNCPRHSSESSTAAVQRQLIWRPIRPSVHLSIFFFFLRKFGIAIFVRPLVPSGLMVIHWFSLSLSLSALCWHSPTRVRPFASVQRILMQFSSFAEANPARAQYGWRTKEAVLFLPRSSSPRSSFFDIPQLIRYERRSRLMPQTRTAAAHCVLRNEQVLKGVCHNWFFCPATLKCDKSVTCGEDT